MSVMGYNPNNPEVSIDRVMEKNGAAQFLNTFLEMKRQSVFCFEPPGTTVGRKSIVDSLLSGCIPVLFDPRQDELFPWHWDSWRNHSRVLLELPPQCIEDYKGRRAHVGAWKMSNLRHPNAKDRNEEEMPPECGIIEMLEAIPEKVVKRMQQTIAKNMHKMQYALVEYGGDAHEMLLRGAQQSVHYEKLVRGGLHRLDRKDESHEWRFALGEDSKPSALDTTHLRDFASDGMHDLDVTHGGQL